ncbi:MraY family glycosyltransferase [Rapidithrix thailandica]|uniref:MraY family glycosyltransferase n=1 Tax=Rapidithrix thailandica TaxID=413964 RepID=A0AAW9S7V6_9BACT
MNLSEEIELLITGVSALIVGLILVPRLKRWAVKVKLVDKPNHRKLHTEPIPLVGGIAIAIASFLTLLLSEAFIHTIDRHLIVLGASTLLLIVGVLDDKMDIKPLYRLLIQMGCAYAVASSGIRISSFYGIFGMYELPLTIQYIFTILVITGVINAFNLMDGIDGLAGGLSIMGFGTLVILSYLLGRFDLGNLYIAFFGATAAFLKHNLSKKKIFMGDGGSLFLGFTLVIAGIQMIELASQSGSIRSTTVLLIIMGIFWIPVLDSIRVYRSRIKKGVSPFTADKNHLHHLFLLTGLSHQKTSLLINLSALFFLLSIVVLAYYFPLTIVLFVVTLLFILLASVLNINKSLNEWRNKIREMEED